MNQVGSFAAIPKDVKLALRRGRGIFFFVPVAALLSVLRLINQ